MHISIQNTFRFLGSRLARNLYFWIFLFSIKQMDLEDQYAYSNAFYYAMIAFLMLFFVALTYFNNLFLVPRLLMQKKWLLYFGSALAFIFSLSFIYTLVLKLLPRYFPGISPLDLSIVVTPVSNDISFKGILSDIDTFFITMVIWTIIFTLFAYANEAISKMKRMEEIINKHREAELAFLKNQINPHFLFNTLNNLYSLSLKKSDETPEAILKLSSILRYILYESNVERISFDKEKEIMQAYIDIELLRLPETPEIQFSMMADQQLSIPPLLWLPLLENVFKHSRSAETPEIDFRFNIRNNQLSIYSRNSVSANASKETAVGGIGLSNLRKRLDLLYPEKHSIRISSDQKCFIIEVQITLD